MKYLIALIVCTVSFASHAKEWSFSDSKENKSIRLSVSTCYDDSSKYTLSFENSENSYGYNSRSVSATCDCGETLTLNDTVKLTSSSFTDVVENGLPFLVKTYQCSAE